MKAVTLPEQNSGLPTSVNRHLSRMFWLPSLGHFTNDFCNGFLAPLLPIIVVNMDISLAHAGLLYSAFAVSSSLLQPVAGVIADRLRRHYFVLVGPVLAATFMGFIGWVEQYRTLLFILTVSGIGTAVFHPQGATMVGDLVRHRRGFHMSIFNMSGVLGMTLGSMIIVPLTSAFGLKTTMVAVVPAAVMFLCALRPVLRSPAVQTNTHDRTNPFKAVKPHLPRLTRLFFIVVIRATIILAFTGFIPLFLFSQGQSPVFAGIALGLYQFFLAMGMLLGGHFYDRIGARNVFVLSFIFTLPFALGFVTHPSVWGLPFLIVMGTFSAFSTPVNILLAQEIVPEHANFTSAIMMGFGWGVAGLLLFPFGVMADHIGLSWTLILVSTLSLVGIKLSLSFGVSKRSVGYDAASNHGQVSGNCRKEEIHPQEAARS